MSGKIMHELIGRYVERHGPVAGNPDYPIHHHHVVGRSYVHNKVPIGEYFVIPLPWTLHCVSSDDPNNVTLYPKNFVKTYGKQSGLWWNMVRVMMADDEVMPFGNEVVEAIMDTNK